MSEDFVQGDLVRFPKVQSQGQAQHGQGLE